MPAMSAAFRVSRRWLALGAGLIALAARSEEDPARQTVVLANGNMPESVELARHYLAARALPEAHLCVLDLPQGERISRGFYELRLRDPLLAFLRERRLIDQVRRDPKTVRAHETAWTTVSSSLRYVVSVYGVPVRVADTRPALLAAVTSRLGDANRRNDAAVDAELALLLDSGYPIAGPKQNPLYNQLSAATAGGVPALLLAARLDGPDPATVRRMVDDTILAERYGLQGRGYFDSRGIREAGYEAGDHWIREAHQRFLREGYECAVEESEYLWGDSYPMEDAAVYMGWYAEEATGPFARSGLRFRPGAVAYHIHSSSASALRSGSKNWAGPLLARGAAATMGAVSEPYLSLTPHLNLFADRLCAGRTFGESAYLSMSAVSWQVTVVGDPLYRPFRYTRVDQIEHLEQDGRPEVEWAYLRKMNLLVRDGWFNKALDYCRAKLRERDSLVLREKLGDLYVKNDLFAEAVEQYRHVVAGAQTAETAIRVGARLLLLLRFRGEGEAADQLEAELRARWKDSPVAAWLDTAKP